MVKTYQNWIFENGEIAWAGLDRKEVSVNTVNESVLEELADIIKEVSEAAEEGKCIGLILYSAKEKGFIAGADVHELSHFNADAARRFIHQGQSVLDRLAGLCVPTVAMMQGFCLGGGAELALACRYRVMADSDDVRFGLPEVLLGIHPGWGGTVRLPRLIGPFKGLPLLLTGKMIRAKEALKLGIADAVVPMRQLRAAAIDFIKHPLKLFQTESFNPLSSPFGIGLYTLIDKKLCRLLLAKMLRRQLRKRVNEQHYPAPYAILKNWEMYGVKNEKSAELAESESLYRMITESESAKQLIRVFELRTKLKKNAHAVAFRAKHLHVIGAGVMGGDIAAWCALRGLKVTLQDQNASAVAKALGRALLFVQKHYKEPYRIKAVMDRLVPDLSGEGIAHADIIIEAVIEDLALKRTIFKALEKKAKHEAVLATNTSSIPLEAIAEVLERPQRLAGIHFFNPAIKMELVEVVQSQMLDPIIFDQTLAFVEQIGKLPVPVKSCPGFLVNRILMPYLIESMVLLKEGFPAEEIDEAIRAFGMMMGPVELADTVGLDVCLAVAKNLLSSQEEQEKKVLLMLEQKVREGELGKKTRKGFYVYNRQGKKSRSWLKYHLRRKVPDDRIVRRLIAKIIKESELCLKQGVAADADSLDAAMIFGTGFAPFRGGPIQYAKTLEKLESM